MFKPEVEVVRFQNRDVIATSGVEEIAANTPYKVLGSEAMQCDPYGTKFVGPRDATWITMTYDPNSSLAADGFYYTSNAALPDYDDDDRAGIYAWYNDGTWWTENKALSSYGYDYTNDTRWRTK